MTPNVKKEIQQAVIQAGSAFGVDHSLSHQSMSFVGLKQMRKSIPVDELVEVLKSMEGVILELEANEVRIPTNYFTQ